MEHRVVLSNQEAFEIQSDLKILSTVFIKDEYTGTKRYRWDDDGERIKDYVTPVKGIIYKFTSACEYKGIKDVWFEYKWADKIQRFEIEFEGNVPKEFADRPNIHGWNILAS